MPDRATRDAILGDLEDAKPTAPSQRVWQIAELLASEAKVDTLNTLSDEELGEAVRAFLRRLPDRDDPTEHLGPYFDSAGLRRRLGITRQAISRRVARQTLLQVPTDEGVMLYPTWQFTPELEVVGGVAQTLRVLHELAHDGFSKAVWMKAPRERLGGRTPIDYLLETSDIDSVVGEARTDVDRMRR